MKVRGYFSIPGLAVRDRLARERRSRVAMPVDHQVMEFDQLVSEYHAGGLPGGSMRPVYELCASAISRLLPEGGRVIDLGAATGRCAAVLAEHRPDAQITAVDLSGEMVRSGRSALAAQGLADRVAMRVGDMRSFGELVPDDVAVVASSWALENLPTFGDMDRCLAEIASVRERTHCAVWLFDFARLNSARSYPALQGLVNGVTPLLARNGVTGEAAAPTFSEMQKQLETAGLHGLNHAVFQPLAFLQAHWAPGRSTGDAHERLWQDLSLPLQTRIGTAVLRAGLRPLP
ncbi:MAG: class I SAM-dependent methyltransferase [Solirubrobacteraceae bacterium]